MAERSGRQTAADTARVMLLLGLPLATKDGALSRAALKAGVRLFEPGT